MVFFFPFFSHLDVKQTETESSRNHHRNDSPHVVLDRKTMGDSMINPAIEYDYLIKFLALGDSGVGKIVSSI